MGDATRRERLLQQIEYLRGLPAGDRQRLAAASRLRRVATGERLFSEGTPAEGVFLIVAGRVRVLRTGVDGREQVLHEESAGATLAEVPVFDGGGCVGTAVATEDAEVLVVPRIELLRALGGDAPGARALIAVLAARVRTLASLVADLSFKPVIDRLAGYLLREARRAEGGTVTLPATRDELASHIGTVREQASRALSQLARAGAIEVRGRSVVITNVRQLEAFGAGDDERGTG